MTKITIETLETLLTDAAMAGDLEMVAICDRALGGDVAAIEECAHVVNEAWAQELIISDARENDCRQMAEAAESIECSKCGCTVDPFMAEFNGFDTVCPACFRWRR